MTYLKAKYRIVILLIIILFLFIMDIGFVNGDLFSIFYNSFIIAPTVRKADGFLQKNIADLSFVIEKLHNMNYGTVSIPQLYLNQEEYYMEVKTGSEYLDREKIHIPDELIGPVKALYKNGVQSIFRGRDYIDITLWSSMNESRGIIFS